MNSTQERLSVSFYIFICNLFNQTLLYTIFFFKYITPKSKHLHTLQVGVNFEKWNDSSTRQLNTKKNANRTLNTFASDHWTRREKQVKIFMVYNNDVDSSTRPKIDEREKQFVAILNS